MRRNTDAHERRPKCCEACQTNLNLVGLSRYLGGRSGGVATESCQDLQDVLNHRWRRSDHLQNVAQPWENLHPQQTLERSREESVSVQMELYSSGGERRKKSLLCKRKAPPTGHQQSKSTDLRQALHLAHLHTSLSICGRVVDAVSQSEVSGAQHC